MTGSVQECDFLAIDFNLVRADVLSNATSFACRDLGFANGVEQGGFAVVDMTHDGDDRGDNNRVVLVTCSHHGFISRESATGALYRWRYSKCARTWLEAKVFRD